MKINLLKSLTTTLLITTSLTTCIPAYAAVSYNNDTIKPEAKISIDSYTHHPVPANYKGYVYITGDYVNIRNGNSIIRGQFMRGDRVYIEGIIDGQGWYKLHNEKVYIAGQYLSTVKE